MNTWMVEAESDSEFEPGVYSSKKNRINKKKSKETKVDRQICQVEQQLQKTSYRWLPAEHAQYVKFLFQQRKLFDLPLQRKITLRIHKLMSQQIQNRSPRQCRSHHQKMIAKHKTIDNIIFENRHLLLGVSESEPEPEPVQTSREGSSEKNEAGNDHSDLLDNFFQLQMFAQSPIFCEHYGFKEIQSYQYEEAGCQY